jgi:hypothetical protein
MRRNIIAMSSAALAAVALSLSGAGAGAASAQPALRGAPDATPACGSSCFNLSSELLGTYRIQTSVGSGIYLQLGHNTLPAQDFTLLNEGTLAVLCGGPISAAAYVCSHAQFPANETVWEWAYAPYGNVSGTCEGVTAASSGRFIEPKACGRQSTNMWVANSARGTGPGTCTARRYCPWYSAAGTGPLVLRLQDPPGRLSITSSPGTGTAPVRQQFCMLAGSYPPPSTC